MVWEANPWREIQTDLYRLDNTTLTAIRYGDEILHSLQTPRWRTLTPGLMWTEFAGTSWRINEYHWLAPKLAWPKSNRAPHYVSVHLTPSGWTSRLSRNSVMPCPDLGGTPQDTTGRLIRSRPWCHRAYTRSRGGQTNDREPFWVGHMTFQWNKRATFFSLVFGVSLNSAPCIWSDVFVKWTVQILNFSFTDLSDCFELWW